MVPGYVNVATDQGDRSYQEDRYVVYRYDTSEEKGWLLAIMDGHSGSAEVAELCEKNLQTYFNNLAALVFEHTDAVLENILKNTISALHEATKDMYSGSTVSLVYISETKAKAFVAILGDSPVMIKNKNGSLVMSMEHNARTNLAEREAAVQRGAVYDGGYIWDDPQSDMGTGLQLTRGLGDKKLARYISREPEIYSVDLDPESFVAVMSDGVVDPGHKDQKDISNRLFLLITNGATAVDLVNDSLKRKTGDNVTAIVWRKYFVNRNWENLSVMCFATIAVFILVHTCSSMKFEMSRCDP